MEDPVPMPPRPSYLRIVATARCSLACSYCHQEGDAATAQAGGLPTELLSALIGAGLDQGVRKLKFLGGEPLLRADLPEIIRRARAEDPGLDISLITGGAVDTRRLDACFDAGLSRANLSVHGWGLAAFQARTQRGPAAWGRRQATLAALLDQGRPLKLNFVWRGDQDERDLAELLDVAAGLPVVLSVLDDLGQPALGPAAVINAVTALRGPADARHVEEDPHSLPTLRLRWRDGLEVEVKDHPLGALAPWRSCSACPARAQCREGIYALRLSHTGALRPCLDRPELGVDLVEAWARGGRAAVARAWEGALQRWLRPASEEAACA